MIEILLLPEAMPIQQTSRNSWQRLVNWLAEKSLNDDLVNHNIQRSGAMRLAHCQLHLRWRLVPGADADRSMKR
jgi:hypothetical protein